MIIYKKCYNKCKKCNQSGNELTNNCEECIDNYTFINDSVAVRKNSYKICEFNYYFNENEQYVCTESDACPSKFEKLIESKKKCIDDCKKDDDYLYDYNNNCYETCPENTKIYEDIKLCLDECYENQFEYDNYCYNECPNQTYRMFKIKNNMFRRITRKLLS